MNKRFAALLACCVVFTSQVEAFDLFSEGWYIKGISGFNILPDQSFATSTGVMGVEEFKIGQSNGAALGYKCDAGFRLEAEVGYRTNHLDTWVAAGAVVTVAAEDRTCWSLMVNALYEIDFDTSIKPYVGGGIGVGLDGFHGVGSGFAIDDTDVVFAYQVMGGLNYLLDDNWELFAEYRYFGTTDPKWSIAAGAVGTLSSEYDSHSINLGTTYHF